MIYNEYRIKLYQNKKGVSPILDYLEGLPNKEKAKIIKYIEFLREHKGYLDEPYSRHIKGAIRELRIDFNRRRHRIFYFTFVKQIIVLLHVFLKKTEKTPSAEIKKAEENHNDVLNNQVIYE